MKSRGIFIAIAAAFIAIAATATPARANYIRSIQIYGCEGRGGHASVAWEFNDDGRCIAVWFIPCSGPITEVTFDGVSTDPFAGAVGIRDYYSMLSDGWCRTVMTNPKGDNIYYVDFSPVGDYRVTPVAGLS